MISWKKLIECVVPAVLWRSVSAGVVVFDQQPRPAPYLLNGVRQRPMARPGAKRIGGLSSAFSSHFDVVVERFWQVADEARAKVKEAC